MAISPFASACESVRAARRLAAAAALRQPGAFGEYRNYRGQEVLATSRPLRSTPWLLVQEVDAAQALMDKGAKSVTACITHGVLSGPAVERISKRAFCVMYPMPLQKIPSEFSGLPDLRPSCPDSRSRPLPFP